MGSLFTPDIPAATTTTVEVPKVKKATRMPTSDDTSMLEAASRTRKSAMSRSGRQSTIMTDSMGNSVGSSGKKLGA